MKTTTLLTVIIIILLISNFTLIFFCCFDGAKYFKKNEAIIEEPKITETEEEIVTTLSINNIADAYPFHDDCTDFIIENTSFHISYNEQTKQANWVAYILTSEMVEARSATRLSYFSIDPAIDSSYATHRDYTGTGFDRGHLVPAADMNFCDTSMAESFYTSNISPQRPELNRGIWKTLEDRVRQWALENDSLYIVAGPIFCDEYEVIGDNEIPVPCMYFKVVKDISYKDGYKAIGFIMENKGSDNDIFEYAVPLRYIEKKINIDFFFPLKNNLTDSLEMYIDIEAWQKPEA